VSFAYQHYSILQCCLLVEFYEWIMVLYTGNIIMFWCFVIICFFINHALLVSSASVTVTLNNFSSRLQSYCWVPMRDHWLAQSTWCTMYMCVLLVYCVLVGLYYTMSRQVCGCVDDVKACCQSPSWWLCSVRWYVSLLTCC